MSDIKIRTGRKYSATVIPNIFIDRYMAEASGLQLKVYLYVLRCLPGGGIDFSIASAADTLDETEKDVKRALDYWGKKGLLEIEQKDNEITSIMLTDLSKDPELIREPGIVAAPAVISIQEPVSDPEPKNYSREDIRAALEDPEISWLAGIVGNYLEKVLTNEDVSLIIFIYKELGFSKDLLLHLYEVCVNRNKKNRKYIQTVAVNWYKEGIRTPEEAESQSVMYDEYFGVVNRSWNLGRLPGDKEQKFIRSWKEMEIPLDLIREACDKTLLSTGKPNFSYANKILTNWHEKGYTTLEQAQNDKTVPAVRKTPAKASGTKSAAAYKTYLQNDYSNSDLAEIERQLLVGTGHND